MTVATTFATIVSLVADFVAHRSANEGRDLDSFMAWLAEHRHEELRTLLQSNGRTAISIKALLSESRETILQRLNALDETLATLASGLEPYREIARAAYPAAELSQQATSLLEEFYDSGATTILEVQYQSGEVVLAIVDGPNNGQLKYTEPRFVQDDLTTLVELGLLDLSFNDRGDRMFRFKRSAATLVEHRRRT